MKIKFKKVACLVTFLVGCYANSFAQCNWQTLPAGESVNSIARVKEDRKVLRSEVFTTAEGAVYAAYYFDDGTLSLVPFNNGAWQLSSATTLDSPDGTIANLKGWALGKIGTDNVFIAIRDDGGWWTKNLTTNTNWTGGYIPAIAAVVNTVKDVAFHPTSGEIYLLRQPNTTTLAWSKINTIAYTFTDLGTIKDVTTNTVYYDGGGASATTTTANTVSSRYMPQLKFYGSGDAIVSYGLHNSLTTFGSGFYPRAVRYNSGSSSWGQVTTQYNSGTRESFINELTSFPFFVESRANDFAISDGPGKPFFTMRPESNPPAYSLYEIDAASNNANNISSGGLNTLSALHTYSAPNNDFYGAYSDYTTTTFFKRDNATGVVTALHSMPTVFVNASNEAKGINLFLSGTSLYALEGSRHRNGFFGDYNHQTPSQTIYKTRSLTAPFSVLESNFWMNDVGNNSTYSKIFNGENDDLFVAYADTMFTDSTYRVAFKKWNGTAWVASAFFPVFGSSADQVEDFDVIYNGSFLYLAQVKPTGDCILHRLLNDPIDPILWQNIGTASASGSNGPTRFVRIGTNAPFTNDIVITTASKLGTVNKIKVAEYVGGTLYPGLAFDLNFQAIANKYLMQTVSITSDKRLVLYKTQSFVGVKSLYGVYTDWSTTFNTDFNTGTWTSFDAQYDNATLELRVAYNTNSLNTNFKRAKVNSTGDYDATATSAFTQLGSIGNAIYNSGFNGRRIAFTQSGSKIYALTSNARNGNHRMAMLKGDITTGVWESGTEVSFGQSTNQDMLNSPTYGVVAKWGGNNLRMLNLPGAPAAPVDATASLNVCSGQTKTLTVTATPGATVNWFTSATGGTAIGTGTSFTTPALTSATSYYAEATSPCGTSTTRTEITLAILALPTVTINPSIDQSICAGNGIYLEGQGAATYAWNNGYTNATTYFPTVGGNYIVTGTASNGCSNTDTVAITLLNGPTLTPSFTTNDTLCFGSVFSINVAGSGYIFDAISSNINGTTYTFSNATNIVAQSSGAYFISAEGSVNGCNTYDTLNLVVQNTAAPTHASTQSFCSSTLPTFADITVTGTNVEWYTTATGGTPIPLTNALTSGTYYSSQTLNGCPSSTRGSITITVNTSPTATLNPSICGSSYTYGGITYTSSGTYNQTATAPSGCDSLITINLTLTPIPNVSIVSNPTNTTLCQGESVTLTASGAINLTWNNSVVNGVPFVVNSSTLYQVTGTTNGCSSTASVQINVNTLPVSSISSTNTSCTTNTGTVTLATVTGGLAPYTYSWNNGATTQNLTNVGVGVYTVTVVDANGCSSDYSISVNSNNAPTLSVTGTTDLLCNGDSNGSIDLTSTGGTGTLTYDWDDSNNSTTQDLSGIGAGTYTVIVTDASNCSSSIAYTITEPTAISESAVATNVSCGGAADGSIDITVTGGVGQYSYVWSNGATTEDLMNLSGNTYSVVITDNNGCVHTSTIYDVMENDPIVITGTTTDANCGQTDGSIDITIVGGASLGTISWSNSSSTEDLTNVAAGSYIVTVTDVDGCTETVPFNVNSIGGPVVNGTSSDASCATSTDGAIDISVTGSGPFTYSWDNGSSTEDLTGLAPGTYTVTVNGSIANCPSFGTYIIDGQNYVATATQSGSTITADVSGATYEWINCSSGATIAGETDQSFTATANGSYAVIVTEGQCSDTTACIVINNAGVDENDQLEIVIYPNPSNGIFFMQTSEPVSYTVYDALGKIILSDQFDSGLNKIDLYSETDGVYILQLTVDNSIRVVRLIKNN